MILRNFICSLFLIGTAVSTDPEAIEKIRGDMQREADATARFKEPTTTQTNPNFKGDWTQTFETLLGPITHTPTSVSLGEFNNPKYLHFGAGTEIKGYKLPLALNLHVDSSLEEFILALNRAEIYNK